MILKLTRILSLLSAIGLIISSVSCHKAEPLRERGVLETIPARARVVACVDFDALLKSSGCRSNSGSISLTKDLSRLIEIVDSSALPIIKAVAQSGGVADLKQVYLIADTLGVIFTAPIHDNLRKQPEDDINVKGAPTYLSPLLGEIEVIDMGDGVGMARSGSQIWWVKDCPVPLGHIIDYIVGEADLDPISDSEGIVELLMRPAQAKVIAKCNVRPNPLGDPFDAVYAELRLANRSVAVTSWALRNGERVEALWRMPAVDPTALLDMPPGMMAYAAVGVNDILPIAIKQMSESWPLATRIGVGAVIDVMNTEGGTMAIGVAPGGSAESIRNLSLDNWLVKAVMPVDPEKGDDAAELISILSAGKLFSRADSVYLEVAGYDLNAYELTSQGDIYGDPKAVAYMSIPYNHQAMKAFRLRNGYTLDFYATDSEATALLTVHGPASYILPALISDAITIANLQKAKN